MNKIDKLMYWKINDNDFSKMLQLIGLCALSFSSSLNKKTIKSLVNFAKHRHSISSDVAIVSLGLNIFDSNRES